MRQWKDHVKFISIISNSGRGIGFPNPNKNLGMLWCYSCGAKYVLDPFSGPHPDGGDEPIEIGIARIRRATDRATLIFRSSRQVSEEGMRILADSNKFLPKGPFAYDSGDDQSIAIREMMLTVPGEQSPYLITVSGDPDFLPEFALNISHPVDSYNLREPKRTYPDWAQTDSYTLLECESNTAIHGEKICFIYLFWED
jgi:hypothetical protein